MTKRDQESDNAIALFLLFLLHSVLKTFCLLLWLYVLWTASLLQLLHYEEEASIACARSSKVGPYGTQTGSWLVESKWMTSYHFRCGKPLTSGEKRIVGSWEPEVTWFGRGNRWPVEKIDRGLKMGKNRWRVWKIVRGLKGKENRGENAGSKVQSPIWWRGVTHIWFWSGTSGVNIKGGKP